MQHKSKIALSLVKIFRPGNVLIAMAAVVLGQVFFFGPYNLNDISSLVLSLVEALVMGLLAGAGNIENDVVDYDIDKINASHRPLPSGVLSIAFAKTLFVFVYIIAITLAFLLSWLHGVWAIAIALVLVMYNRYYQKMPFVGNLAVAFLCAQAVAFPILRYNDPFLANQGFAQATLVFIMTFAFIYTWAREMIKDIEDYQGDFELNLRTAPIVLGVTPVRVLSLLLIWLGILGVLLSFKLPLFESEFSSIASFSVILPSLISIKFLSQVKPNWRKAQFFLKLSLLGGVIAIFVSLV